MTKLETLRMVREHAAVQGVTLRQLCALADVHYITVWRWGQSETKPRQRTVDALLNVRVKHVKRRPRVVEIER